MAPHDSVHRAHYEYDVTIMDIFLAMATQEHTDNVVALQTPPTGSGHQTFVLYATPQIHPARFQACVD